MSRKKIAAATMTLAALGLGFAGYMQVTRANDTDEHEHEPWSGDESFADHRAYLANHQAGHGAAIFNHWSSPEEKYLPHSGSAEPLIGQRDDNAKEDSSKEDKHALRGSGKPHEQGNGDVPHLTGGDAGGGRYASNGGSHGGGDHWSGSNFSVWSGFGNSGFALATASKKRHDDPSNGSTNPRSGNTPNDNPNTQDDDSTPPGPGGSEPTAGDPPSNDGDSTQQSNDAPPGPGTNESNEPPPSGTDGTQGEETKGGEDKGGQDPGPGTTDPDPTTNPGDTQGGNDLPPTDPPPPETHAVPEPGTLGLLAFGLAAAALRRRRRS